MNDFRISRLVLTLFLVISTFSLRAQVSVTTQHNDISRTGQNTSEVVLTPTNVKSGSFGKLYTASVDGAIYAQPLYLPNVTFPSVGTHNVVFIATEHDSIYALDADSAMSPLWKISLIDAAHGASPGAIPEPSGDTGCTNISPEYGVTGTPVIDPSTGTLYVVSVSFENGYAVQRLHALDVKTGAEKLGGPVFIQGTVVGTGNGSSNGYLPFDPKWELQRAGLLLLNNNVYAAFAAHCDLGPFHGWIFGYDATTLAQTAVFVTTPNGEGGGIWMGGTGLAADTSTTYPRVFVPTGNGSYDATLPYGTNNMDYSDGILKLTANNGLHVTDAFTAYNQASLSPQDLDVAGGGVLIPPDQTGPVPHVAIQLGKSGSIYLVNRENLGGYSTAGNNIVQEIDGQTSGLWGAPAYWNGNVYFWGAGSNLRQYTLSNGALSRSAVAQSNDFTLDIGNTPSVSANGNSNGVVWAIDYSGSPEVLTAHDASNVANVLYTSAANPARDSAGGPIRFAVPTIANGKVYVGSNGGINVYGLLPTSDFSFAASPASLVLAQGGSVTDILTIMSINGFNAAVSLSASGLPSGVTATFAAGAGTSSSTLTLVASASAVAGQYTVNITGTSGALTHSTSISLQVQAVTQADFSLAASSASLVLNQSGNVTDTITITSIGGFNGAVSLSASGLPSGVTAGFSAGTSASSSTLTLTASATAAAGAYTVSIIGTSGAISHSIVVSLQVQASNVPDFSLTANPAAITLYPGALTVNGISLLRINGFSANPALSVAALPAGVTASFTSVSSTYYTLSLSATASVTPGSTALIVTGTSGSLVHTIAFTLTIAASPNFTSVQLEPNNTFKCLTVLGNSTASGASIVESTCTGASGQLWNLVALGGDTYEIVSVNSGMALSSLGGSTAAGTPIVQSAYTNSTSQKWFLQGTPWNFYYILNAQAGICLDVAGASSADGTAIDQTGCTGATNQLWTVVPH